MPRRRRGFSAEQKAEIWRRWKTGQSLSDISRALGRVPGTVHNVLSANGGFVPPVRRRSRLALTPKEREEISRGLASGLSMRQVARRLQRAPSTITREVARNGGASGYRASLADTSAWHRARRLKSCRLEVNSKLRRFVAQKLQENWSPEQIAGALPRVFPQESAMRISHETIYKSLFIQARSRSAPLLPSARFKTSAPTFEAFEAQSHGLHTRCLRFAAGVAPVPRKTRFRVGASLSRAGFAPARSLREVSAFYIASSSPRLVLAHETIFL
jgi:IS30 family transposase